MFGFEGIARRVRVLGWVGECEAGSVREGKSSC
jgi:hypothetical protein